MAHSYHHSVSSSRKFGGVPEDYLAIHTWFDASKAGFAGTAHRAMRHHSEGIFWAEEVFGSVITNSDGRKVPVRLIGEQHVQEDLGFIPSMAIWLRHMSTKPWMDKPTKLSRTLYENETLGEEEKHEDTADNSVHKRGSRTSTNSKLSGGSGACDAVEVGE